MSATTDRTAELRARGAKSLTDGDRHPFVNWPKGEETMWVEGELLEIWEGSFGNVARIAVEPGSTVNIGCSYALLKRAVTSERVGKVLHVAFTGWGETEAGQAYRQFDVLELGELPAADAPTTADGDVVVRDDVELPF